MTDFTFMVSETSHMFITGPDVIKTVTGETVTQEELGGAMSHASKSGVAHVVAGTDEDCLDRIRYLMSFIPVEQLRIASVLPADRRPEAIVRRPPRPDPGLARTCPTTCTR